MPPTAGQEYPNWENPIGGERIERPEQAQLAFVPNVPDGLGEPMRIVATAPGQAPLPDREISWTYLHAEYGVFVVIQHMVDRPPTELEYQQFAGQEPGCTQHPSGELECHSTRNTLLTLNNRVTALLSEGDTNASIAWLEPFQPVGENAAAVVQREFSSPAVEIRVIGLTLTGDEAVEIANGIEAG